MMFSIRHVRRFAFIVATHGSQCSASDISIMPLLHDDFQDSLLAGLSEAALTTGLAEPTFTPNFANDTDFEMEDFEEGAHFISECPPYEAMVLSSWTQLDSGGMRLYAELPNVDHGQRQAWIDDDKISLHVRAERVVPSEGARCLPENVQLTADGSHELFEAAMLLPPGVDFTRIVLRELDAGLEFLFPADDATRDEVEDNSTGCPHYEQMEVVDWNLLANGEFVLEANLPAVEPEDSRVKLSEDGTALHVHAWRAMTFHKECIPEGTQTTISGDGLHEIFERVVLLPSQVDTKKLLFAETRQGFRVTVPALVIEEELDLMENITDDQSEEEDAIPVFDSAEEDSFDHHVSLADFESKPPDMCPPYHPLQVSPWRMTLAGFQLHVVVPEVDPEELHTNLDARAHRLQVRTSRPVPKEGRLCLPISSQVSADGSQELFDILISMPQGSGVSYNSQVFENGVMITIPFLAGPLQAGFGASIAPGMDPPKKLADVLGDTLKFAEEKQAIEEQFSSPGRQAAEQEMTDDNRVSKSFPDVDDSKPICPEYEVMTTQDWQIVDGNFVLDVRMPGVLPAMRKVEFNEDGLLHISGFRPILAENLLCLPLQAVTTVSLADGLQEVLEATVAMPLGGDSTRVTKLDTQAGLQLTTPIIASGAREIGKSHEV